MNKALTAIHCVLLTAFAGFAANVVFEAETAAETEEPMVLEKAPDGADAEHTASGGAFLHIKEGAGNPPKLEKGFAKFTVDVPATGAYRLWARVKWEGECSNSFTVQIDDRPAFLFGEDMTFGVWHWVKHPVARMAPLLQLEKGMHTIVFRNREDGVALDQILLASDKRFVPVGIAKATTDGGAASAKPAAPAVEAK